MISTLPQEPELESANTLEELDARFRSLIKRYHPDRNPENADWAHFQSRALIENYNKIKKHFQSTNIHIDSQGWRVANETDLRSSASSSRRRTKAATRLMSFRILRAQVSCAIPLQAIARISTLSQAPDHRTDERPFLSDEPQSIVTLDERGDLIEHEGEAPTTGSLLWLLPEQEMRALWLQEHWSLAGIARIDLCSTPILPCTERKGVRLYYKNEILFCPSELVFQEFCKINETCT